MNRRLNRLFSGDRYSLFLFFFLNNESAEATALKSVVKSKDLDL